MSWFGDGSFKQDLLDEIESLIETHNMKKPEAVSEIAEVLAHVACTAFNRDEQMMRVREEAKAEAKRELKARLQDA